MEVAVGVLAAPPGDLFGGGVPAEAEHLGHVAGPPRRHGADGPHQIFGTERYLVDPALAGVLLSQELAVAVQQQDVRVAGRRDRAEGDARGVVIDVEAGDGLPGRQPDAARVPARDLRRRAGRRLAAGRRAAKRQATEEGQGIQAAFHERRSSSGERFSVVYAWAPDRRHRRNINYITVRDRAAHKPEARAKGGASFARASGLCAPLSP